MRSRIPTFGVEKVSAMTARLPLDKNAEFGICSANCTGCTLCQLACSIIKTSAFSLSDSLILIERDFKEGPYEQFTIGFSPLCDSCGFCVNYCAFDALTNLKRAKAAC